MARRFLALALALLSVLSFFPIAAADASEDTDGDAPGDWRAARDIVPGWVNGTIDDGGDWYRVAVPAGHVAVFSMSSNLWGYHLSALSDQGAPLGTVSKSSPWEPTLGLAVGSPDGFVRFGITPNFWSGSYASTVQVVPAPDLRVSDVRISTHEVETEFDQGVPTPFKTVTATVTNRGFAPAHAAHVSATVEPVRQPGGGSRDLGSQPLQLQPGESTTVEFVWDSTGQIGDVEVVVSAVAPEDANPLDNVQRVATFVVVGNAGQGVDVGNLAASAVVMAVHADIWTYYGVDSKGMAASGHADTMPFTVNGGLTDNNPNVRICAYTACA